MAKFVKLAATSAGGGASADVSAQEDTEGLGINPSTLGRGSAVNGAKARGPCWECNSALELSLRPGHTSSRRNFSSNFREGRCCHPGAVWALASPDGVGAVRHVNGSLASSPSVMRSAIAGCRCLTMRWESVQLAQCAAGRTRTALANPSPPAESARVAKVCAPDGAFGVPGI